MTDPSILVACVGNTLRSDDGAGPRVAAILGELDLPAGVDVRDFGIGGIHLVQSLLENAYHALVLVDCADQGRPPGTVMEIEPDVLDVNTLDHITKYDYLADMHYTKPERALALARGLGVLPERVLLVGIQPEDAETLSERLTPRIAAAVRVAADHIIHLAEELLEEIQR